MGPSFIRRYSPYFQIAPLALVFLLFLVGPLIVILIFSVFKFTGFIWEPGFVFDNYERVFTRSVTIKNYVQTIKITAITWVFTLVIGFTLS